MTELDAICQEIKNELVDHNNTPKSEGTGFDEIAKHLSAHSRGTVSLHLREHLIKTGFVSRGLDRKYRWNASQQVNYTPTFTYLLHHLEIDLTQKGKSSFLTTFKVNVEPITSIRWYFPPPFQKTWEANRVKIWFIHKKKKILLDRKHIEFPDNELYPYDFKINYPYPLYSKDGDVSINVERTRSHTSPLGIAYMFPDTTSQKISFKLKCPSDYLLKVWHVNSQTYKEDLSTIPSKTNNNIITWENNSHNLEYYYKFEWSKLS